MLPTPAPSDPFAGITVGVLSTVLASLSVYLTSWANFDRVSDNLGHTAVSFWGAEQDHFDFIIGNKPVHCRKYNSFHRSHLTEFSVILAFQSRSWECWGSFSCKTFGVLQRPSSRGWRRDERLATDSGHVSSHVELS